jgi:flagellar biogenesis protein FliO
MRLIESISLGEKRFIGVIQVDGCEFLVGGGADSVAVLAQLGAPSVPAPGSSAYAAIASCSSEPQA